MSNPNYFHYHYNRVTSLVTTHKRHVQPQKKNENWPRLLQNYKEAACSKSAAIYACLLDLLVGNVTLRFPVRLVRDSYYQARPIHFTSDFVQIFWRIFLKDFLYIFGQIFLQIFWHIFWKIFWLIFDRFFDRFFWQICWQILTITRVKCPKWVFSLFSAKNKITSTKVKYFKADSVFAMTVKPLHLSPTGCITANCDL